MSFRARIIDLTSQTTYPTDPTLDGGFEGQFTVINLCSDSTAYVYVSFDGGVTNEVQLRPNSPSAGLSFSAKRRKIWVRREVGSFSGDLEAQVILEGT